MNKGWHRQEFHFDMSERVTPEENEADGKRLFANWGMAAKTANLWPAFVEFVFILLFILAGAKWIF